MISNELQQIIHEITTAGNTLKEATQPRARKTLVEAIDVGSRLKSTYKTYRTYEKAEKAIFELEEQMTASLVASGAIKKERPVKDVHYVIIATKNGGFIPALYGNMRSFSQNDPVIVRLGIAVLP